MDSKHLRITNKKLVGVGHIYELQKCINNLSIKTVLNSITWLFNFPCLSVCSLFLYYSNYLYVFKWSLYSPCVFKNIVTKVLNIKTFKIIKNFVTYIERLSNNSDSGELLERMGPSGHCQVNVVLSTRTFLRSCSCKIVIRSFSF